MAADVAELSSLSSMLSDLEHRILSLANKWDGKDRDDVLAMLHEAERQLRGANRALSNARKAVERR